MQPQPSSAKRRHGRVANLLKNRTRIAFPHDYTTKLYWTFQAPDGGVAANANTRLESALADFDAIVVGGGLTGMSVAYGLLQRRLTVAVIDEGDVAHRASRGTFGLVWAQSKGRAMPEYARWTRESVKLWPAFAEELHERTGIDVAYSNDGGYMFAFSEQELEQRKSVYDEICAGLGLKHPDYEILDRKAVVADFPGIGDAVRGATFCPLDGDCNPLALLHALHKAFLIDGGKYLPGHRLAEIVQHGSRLVLRTTCSRFETDRIVLAAGIGNARIAQSLGCSLPLRPLRGQILVSERAKPVIPRLTHAVRQTKEGSIMFGDSHEDVGINDLTTAATIRSIAGRAVKTFPFLSSLRIVRSWACLRPMPVDGFPIYDRIPRHPGVIVLNTHSGVTLAAAHARIIATQIADGTLGKAIRHFSINRLDVQATH